MDIIQGTVFSKKSLKFQLLVQTHTEKLGGGKNSYFTEISPNIRILFLSPNLNTQNASGNSEMFLPDNRVNNGMKN